MFTKSKMVAGVTMLALLAMAPTAYSRAHDIFSLVERLNGEPSAMTSGNSTGGTLATLSGIGAGSCLDIFCSGTDARVLAGSTVTTTSGAYVPQNNYPPYTMCLGNTTTSFSFIPASGTTTLTCGYQVRK